MKTFTAKQAREQVINYKAAKIDEARKEADACLASIYEEIKAVSAVGRTYISFDLSDLTPLVCDMVITDLRQAGYHINGSTNWKTTRVMWHESE